MTDRFAWFSVAGTILLTICGQVLIKWRLGGLALPPSFGGKAYALALQLTDPWVIAALAMAVVASFFWMSAMTRLPLGVAYPFTCLSFIIITFLSAIFLREPLSTSRAAGVSLVVIGLVFVARG